MIILLRHLTYCELFSEDISPVAIERQAQIRHVGSDPDLSPLQPQAIARWRRPVIGSATEPHCLEFLRGHLSPNPLITRRPRRPPPAPPDGWSCPTPYPKPAPTCRWRSTPVPNPEASAPEAPRRTRCSTATDPTQDPAGPRGTPPSQSSPRLGQCRRCSGPGGTPGPHPAGTRVPNETRGPGISCPRGCC